MPGRSPGSPSALTLNSDRAASEKCGWVSLNHIQWTHTLSPTLETKQHGAVCLLREGLSVPLRYEKYVKNFHPTRFFNILTQAVCLAVSIFWVIFTSSFSPSGCFLQRSSSQSSASILPYSLHPLSNFMSSFTTSLNLLFGLHYLCFTILTVCGRVQTSQSGLSDFISKTSIMPVPLMSLFLVLSILITLKEKLSVLVSAAFSSSTTTVSKSHIEQFANF